MGWKLSPQLGLGALDMLSEGKLKGLYVAGENPLITYPGQKETRKALEGLEFLVFQDLFLTPTAQHAHVVLPVVSFAEKEGTYTNSERRVQWLNRTVPPPGMAKSDLEIIQRLGDKMSFSLPGLREIWNEIKELVPLYQCIDYAKLGEKGIQWPCNLDSPGVPPVSMRRGSERKARLTPVSFVDRVEPDGEYPMILMTDSSLYHSGTLSSKAPALVQVFSAGFVEMNGSDVERMGFKEGDEVFIRSRQVR